LGSSRTHHINIPTQSKVVPGFEPQLYNVSVPLKDIIVFTSVQDEWRLLPSIETDAYQKSPS
jgi:hypothetical protein